MPRLRENVPTTFHMRKIVQQHTCRALLPSAVWDKKSVTCLNCMNVVRKKWVFELTLALLIYRVLNGVKLHILRCNLPVILRNR